MRSAATAALGLFAALASAGRHDARQFRFSNSTTTTGRVLPVVVDSISSTVAAPSSSMPAEVLSSASASDASTASAVSAASSSSILPTAGPGSTTLTVVATSIHTIVSCAPTVSNCPARGGQTALSDLPESAKVTIVTTETSVLLKTVCPKASAPHISSSVLAAHSSSLATGSSMQPSPTAVAPQAPATPTPGSTNADSGVAGTPTSPPPAPAASSAVDSSVTDGETDTTTTLTSTRTSTRTITLGCGATGGCPSATAPGSDINVAPTNDPTVDSSASPSIAPSDAAQDVPPSPSIAPSDAAQGISPSPSIAPGDAAQGAAPSPSVGGGACNAATITVKETVTVPASTVFVTMPMRAHAASSDSTSTTTITVTRSSTVTVAAPTESSSSGHGHHKFHPSGHGGNRLFPTAHNGTHPDFAKPTGFARLRR